MTTSARTLTDSDVQQFIEDGYMRVTQGFSRETAAAICDRLWDVLESEHGMRRDAPATWTRPVLHIQRSYDGPPFSDAWTPRVVSAVEELLGPGRFERPSSLGWWPVNFPGHHAPPWRPPETGWHVDGIHFHHHIHSREQGILPILILADIDPGGGGTAFVPGSHRVTARILAAAEPDGVEIHDLCRRAVAANPRDRVLEASGRAGDVLLLHPFMLHSTSANTGSRVRFICNPCIALHAPMTLDPAAPGERSPLEQSIIAALL